MALVLRPMGVPASSSVSVGACLVGRHWAGGLLPLSSQWLGAAREGLFVLKDPLPFAALTKLVLVGGTR